MSEQTEGSIRYLKQEEKAESRRLWREAFPEDSEEFDDYYYTEKTKENRILVREDQGEMIAMIQLNPYEIRVRENVYALDYIVGVATKKDRRHEGHMRSLLVRMMEDMERVHTPFTFLMPASEKIYAPFDFRFIFDQPAFQVSDLHELKRVVVPAGTVGEDGRKGGIKGCENAIPDLQKVAEWMETWLHNRYEVYAVRTREYVELLDKELESEDGSWSFYFAGNDLVGIGCEWGLAKKEQRLLYLKDEYEQEAGAAKPAIMARIIDLREFVRNICLKKDCDLETMTVEIGIRDGFLQKNDGLFRWTLDKNGSEIEKTGEKLQIHEGEKKIPVLTIGEMTEWLFGYRKADRADWMDFIRPLNGVFLDEVV